MRRHESKVVSRGLGFAWWNRAARPIHPDRTNLVDRARIDAAKLPRGIERFVFACDVENVEPEQLLLGFGKRTVERLVRTSAAQRPRLYGRTEPRGGTEAASQHLMNLHEITHDL